MLTKLRRTRIFFVYLLLVVMLFQSYSSTYAAVSAPPATEFGSVVDTRKSELAPGAVYTWYNMRIDRGLENMHFVAFDPRNPNLELRAGTKSGYVYGMEGVTKMASYVDAPGSRVIAGINGDFYDLTGYASGVPNGIFMDDGRILNSNSSSFAFGLKSDGSSIYGSPKLTKSVTIQDKTTNLTSINRYRENNQLVLYTPDYAGTTKTTDLGTEVVMKVLSGEVKSGQTMALEVLEVRANKGNAPLAAGTVVLSAAGTAVSAISGLQAGDKLSAAFALDGEWQDVKVAIGGQGPLVKGGVVQTNVGPEGVHPRTAIGTKADGTVVMFEIDGRAPGFSEGVTTEELAKILKDIGVVDAMNLDGGGSSTFVARLPGTSKVQMLNHGSDGGERATGNSLLLVNKAPEQAASRLVVTPNEERILAGSSLAFRAAGVDDNGHPAAFGDASQWSVDPALGSVAADGTFTAAAAAASGRLSVSAGALQGSAEIEVVDRLTELQFPDTIKTFNSGSSTKLSVTALRDGQKIQADNHVFEWRVEGDIGSIDADGVFAATAESGKSGRIYVKHGDIETHMEVNVGLPPVVLEDFESVGNYTASGAAFQTVNIALETDPDYVRSGDASIKLSYDFVGKTGTSGAYVSAKSTDTRIQVPGYPEKIGMWVYGDGKKHWLRGQMRDANNAAFAIDYTDSATGVDWTGWKYVEAIVPKGKQTPLTMDLPVRYMETSNNNKTSGAIYIDQIRAIYGPLQEDHAPPIIKDVYPKEDAVVKAGDPGIYAYAEDDGYDKAAHPGTTLIDPAKIRLYVDGALVTHGLYPPEGRITYKPAVPFEDGYHRLKLAVRDLSGNQTIKEWNFTVDTGTAKFKYNTPAEVYAGHTYSVDITADQVKQLSGGHLELGFDPNVVADLSVSRGDKLAAEQVANTVDADTGAVRVTFSRLEASTLADADILARISYRVKGTAAGKNVISFKSSALELKGASTPKPYLGAPLSSGIAHELKLSWDDYIGQGFTTTFTVTDQTGRPVEGAKLYAGGTEIGGGALATDQNGEIRTNLLTAEVKTYALQAVRDIQYSPLTSFTTLKLAGAETPNNISVTMGQDAATSRGFTWHTHPNTDKTVVELAKAEGFTDFASSSVRRVIGDSTIFNTLDIGTIRVHKATADGLEPGTAYIYRVGDGEGHYSAQGTFQTASLTGDDTKFLVFGDSQAGDLNGFTIWGNTLKQAMGENPDSEFIVHLGDMVDSGFKEQEWNWWFSQAQQSLMSTTAVTVVGNHEVMGTKLNGDYLAHFNNPQNGTDRQKGTNFSFDYKNIHVAVLNSEYDYAEQKEWLRTDLAKTDQKWKFVFFHRGPYGSIYDTESVRNEWTPVLDEFGVNLVMNGHDHIYLRTYSMKGNQPVADGEGTTYIIPGATGPKFYELTPRPWQKITDDQDIQMYSTVEVNGNVLTVQTKTIDGRVVDTFILNKTDKMTGIKLTGKSNLQPGQSDASVLRAVYASGRRLPITEGAAYSSSNVEVATVTAHGLVQALKEGTSVISATYQGLTDSYELTVTKEQPTVELERLQLSVPEKLNVGDHATSVTQAVYSDGSKLILADGVTYSSSAPAVVSVNETTGLLQALSAGESVISAVYGEKTANAKILVLADSTTPTPTPTPTPGSPGLGNGAAPNAPKGQLELKEAQLSGFQNGEEVRIPLSEALTELILPASAGQLAPGKKLVVEASNLTLSIPTDVFRALAGLVKEGESADGKITLKVSPVAEDKLRDRLTLAGRQSGAALKQAGQAYDFALTITTKAGNIARLNVFDRPIEITLPMPSGVNGQLVGLYYLTDDGKAEYVGGTAKGAQVTAKLSHFSTYALLEYDKTFQDLPAAHWATAAVKWLASKHVIEGVSADAFAPNRQVTRAEFAAMLARALDLKGEAASSFSDVSPDQWFADEVALLAQAGIVKGDARGTFSPMSPITRQEMAAMLVRAYEYRSGQKAASGGAATFGDIAKSPAWAVQAIQAASGLGLVQGISAGVFGPAGTGTRAQSAQMMANLLQRT